MKSPLRYPGGKSKLVPTLVEYVTKFTEYREPFLGGGSLFLYLKELYPDKKYWINDIDFGVYNFWKQCRDNPRGIINSIQYLKALNSGRDLYNYIKDTDLPDVQKAAGFFIMNRITFSGTVNSGGFSESAYNGRFTKSSIDRLESMQPFMKNTRITNTSYEPLLDGSGAFIYLDPPYYSNKKSKLYGNRGSLHENFNHEKFADDMKNCKHDWMITYDDDPHIRSLFIFANVIELDVSYSMSKNKTGKELIIVNERS